MYSFLFNYAYFFSTFIVLIVWLPIFVKRKDLRKEMLFSGVLCSYLGATDFLYIPEYWNPPFLFNLMNHFGFSIEDIILWFFIGGIIAVLYEYVLGQHLIKIKGRSHFHLGVIVIFMILYFGLELIFPKYTILNLAFACTSAGVFGFLFRKDLFIQVMFSGVLFMALYVFLFNIFLAVFPEFINKFYSHSNLLGIYFLNLPIEEFMISFGGGMMWSVLYEYTLGYKTGGLKTRKFH